MSLCGLLKLVMRQSQIAILLAPLIALELRLFRMNLHQQTGAQRTVISDISTDQATLLRLMAQEHRYFSIKLLCNVR